MSKRSYQEKILKKLRELNAELEKIIAQKEVLIQLLKDVKEEKK